MGIAMESLAHPEYSGKILGASAACAGLVGAYVSTWKRGLIASPLLLSFLWGFFEDTPQVAHVAHISGAIIGLSCAIAIYSTTTRQPS
jgi:membrane associated rhomboid family serine protease